MKGKFNKIRDIKKMNFGGRKCTEIKFWEPVLNAPAALVFLVLRFHCFLIVSLTIKNRVLSAGRIF
jgi:hypothetical protein